ncbi:YfkD-like protein [Scopulibacillus darangshiensis]|uniref:YfkD-like protein n=1 Tax=Scopulibacillus darangshiensis TaxID=442528 RepID=A0A4R2NRP6_9BACL|nr:YfkD family protein [Scopulibacillus darangshiensis]TCP24530.1 YfkD-like protein [Scopulibacillus darangshiensis]
MLKKIILAICLITLAISPSSYAKEPVKSNQKNDIKVPDSVVDISKENTYPNPSHDEPRLQPSQLTKALLKTAKIDIQNPTLIKLLNESNIHTSKLSLGYHARIYLGKWPLTYESNKTTVNWEYKQVNDNDLDARGSEANQKLTYNQKQQARVMGGLTAKVPAEKEVKKLMLMEAAENTALPISFSTIVGQGTKINRVYHVEPKKVGHLSGYVPAVNEKGKITYGEVYLVLKGGKKYLEVKNLVQQGIGAWIPIQDHVTLRYTVTN